MDKKQQIVLATQNKGKMREFEAFLKDLPLQLVLPNGLDDIEETGFTFVENAIIKARYIAKKTGLPALADDSGLVVRALQGSPGIYSARYAGPKASSTDNNKKLLNELAGIAEAERTAYFYCVLVYLSHERDPTPIICEGKWHGQILTAPKGENGFGYDPIFYVPEQNKSAAELSLAMKNMISHRAIALQAFIHQFGALS